MGREKIATFAPTTMSSNFTLDTLRPSDTEAVARVLHRSLVHWYQSRLNQGPRFGDSHEPFRLFPEVYEALDPGQAVAAPGNQPRAIRGTGRRAAGGMRIRRVGWARRTFIAI